MPIRHVTLPNTGILSLRNFFHTVYPRISCPRRQFSWWRWPVQARSIRRWWWAVPPGRRRPLLRHSRQQVQSVHRLRQQLQEPVRKKWQIRLDLRRLPTILRQGIQPVSIPTVVHTCGELWGSKWVSFFK